MEPNFESMFELAQASENGWMIQCQNLEYELFKKQERIKVLEHWIKEVIPEVLPLSLVTKGIELLKAGEL